MTGRDRTEGTNGLLYSEETITVVQKGRQPFSCLSRGIIKLMCTHTHTHTHTDIYIHNVSSAV